MGIYIPGDGGYLEMISLFRQPASQVWQREGNCCCELLGVEKMAMAPGSRSAEFGETLWHSLQKRSMKPGWHSMRRNSRQPSGSTSNTPIERNRLLIGQAPRCRQSERRGQSACKLWTRGLPTACKLWTRGLPNARIVWWRRQTDNAQSS